MSSHPNWCEQHDDEVHQGPEKRIGRYIVQLTQTPGGQATIYVYLGGEGAELSCGDALAIANALREAVAFDFVARADEGVPMGVPC